VSAGVLAIIYVTSFYTHAAGNFLYMTRLPPMTSTPRDARAISHASCSHATVPNMQSMVFSYTVARQYKHYGTMCCTCTCRCVVLTNTYAWQHACMDISAASMRYQSA